MENKLCCVLNPDLRCCRCSEMSCAGCLVMEPTPETIQILHMGYHKDCPKEINYDAI